MIRVRDGVSAIAAFSEAVSGNVVSPDTVHKRALVCQGCPFRKKTKGVSKVSEVLGLVANKHRVPVDIAGYSCDVCGCSMLLLLPATQEHLHKDSPEEAVKRPESCWIKQERSG